MFEWLFRKKISPRRVDPLISRDVPSQRVIQTVKFDSSLVADEVKTDIEVTLRAMTDIQSRDFDRMYQAALLSVSRGRDLGDFAGALFTLDDGMTQQRASAISRHVNNRATSLMQNARQLKLGITHAIWRYSGAPCGGARQDAAHRRLDSKRFSISKGMLIGKRRTWPGQDEGCKCTQQPVISGFD